MRPAVSTLALGFLLSLAPCTAHGTEATAQTSRDGRWFISACDEDAVASRAAPDNMDPILEWGHCAGYVSGLSDMLNGLLSMQERVTGVRNALGICLPERGMSGGMWMELLRSYLDRHSDALDTPLRTVLLLASRETFPCRPAN